MNLVVNKIFNKEQEALITKEFVNDKEFIDLSKRIDEYGYRFELTIRPIETYAKSGIVFHPYEMLLVSKDETYYVTICASVSLNGIRNMLKELLNSIHDKKEFDKFVELTKDSFYGAKS